MLLTKLHIPSQVKNIVHRSKLFDKLDEGLNRKLILASAPAGFGKTTLLTDWIHKQKISTAWFSLDKGDNDPVDFLSYIISGIQSIKNEFGLNALALLKSSNLPAFESIINLLINDILNINQNFLLVLDDFHLIENKEIVELVNYLLDHIPGNIHIAILTRSDPTLPIARLRSQHELVELRSSDLSFSAIDISVLFNKKLKLKLTPDDIYTLETKTEGWIAGLQLTALSIQGHKDSSGFIQKLKGDNRYIMDYLIEEVLKIQSDEIKEFLLHTSILKQISAPLCNAVLERNDSRNILEKLEKNNMFVFPLDTERQWYRYHHLFADLLKQRLFIKDKSIINKLHKKACVWFEQNNMYNLAIEHAFEINNFEKSIQLLSEIVEEMWKNGQHAAILKYGRLLPDELIHKNPHFSLYYSWILIGSGQIKKAEPFLVHAEETTKKIVDENNSSKKSLQHNNKLLGKIAVAFAYLNSHKLYSEKTLDYCKIAMKNLSEDDPLWFSWAWFSYGVAHFSEGEFLESKKAFNSAFEYGKKSGNIYLMSTIVIRLAENEQLLGNYRTAYKRCSDLLSLINDKGYLQFTKTEWTYAALYFIMGITQFMRAETEQAYENLKIAYDLSKNEKDIYLKTYILFGFSIALLELQNIEAEKKIKELENLLEKNTIPPYLTSMYIGWKLYILIDKNQIEQANNVVLENNMGLDKEKNHANEAAYAAYVRLLLIQYKLDEAERLLAELYALATAGNRIERLIELKISYAVLFGMRGEQETALTHLMDAMEIAAEESLMSFFVMYREHISDLLNQVFKIHATTQNNIPQKFIDKLKLAIERRKARKKNQVDSELSARELDTLQLIADNLINQEIADKLFISINTVKSHVKNILLKLDADNRVQAVNKAKELGIL